MAFKFSNTETEANYEAPLGVDKFITIQKVYWGLLSNITPEVAEVMIAKQDNQVKRKNSGAKGFNLDALVTD